MSNATSGPQITPMRDCGEGTDLLFTHGGPYIFVPAHHFTAGEELAIAGPWQQPQQSAVVISGIPPEIGGIAVTRSLVDHGLPVGSLLLANPGPVTATHMVTNKSFVPMPAGATLLVLVDGYPTADGTSSSHFHLARWGTPSSNTYVDLGTVHLPPIETQPRYDASDGAVRWSEGAGDLPDAALVRMSWSDNDIGQTNTWLIASPLTGGNAIHLPVLPADVAPATTPTVERLATFAVKDGYDQVRARMVSANAFDVFPPSGPSGEVSTQSFSLLSPD